MSDSWKQKHSKSRRAQEALRQKRIAERRARVRAMLDTVEDYTRPENIGRPRLVGVTSGPGTSV